MLLHINDSENIHEFEADCIMSTILSLFYSRGTREVEGDATEIGAREVCMPKDRAGFCGRRSLDAFLNSTFSLALTLRPDE